MADAWEWIHEVYRWHAWSHSQLRSENMDMDGGGAGEKWFISIVELYQPSQSVVNNYAVDTERMLRKWTPEQLRR